ncbi:thioredoxin family protein [bacterium]|nr:thioredoxin family protein [bacterium]
MIQSKKRTVGGTVLGRSLALSLLALLAALACAAGVLAQDGVTFNDPRALVDSKNAMLLDPLADRAKAGPGEEFTLILRLSPARGVEEDGTPWEFHTYGAQQTGNSNYVPTTFTMQPSDGITWEEPVFPTGELKEDAGGEMWVIYGQSSVLIKGRVNPDAAPGPRTFSAKMMFSTCTEEFCLMPSRVSIEWPFEITAAPVAAATQITPLEELTVQAPIDYSRFKVEATPQATPGGLESLVGGGQQTAESGGGVDLGKVKAQTDSRQLSIWALLGLAFIGGLILNVMPCVLPVVSIKVIELVRSVEKDPKHVINHGVVFAAGIIATFLIGAIIIAIIQAAGTSFGWGNQFQSPAFVMVMAGIIFIFGLSMAGVFTIKPPRALTEGTEQLAEKEGYGGSFFKGVLATVLGTPCVGPFLGPALGYAFTRTWKETLLIFAMVGIGMAIPYLAMLPFVTRLGRRERGNLSRKLQDSRTWLIDFERVMAFLLFATVVYLLSIMGGGMGSSAVIWMLVWLTVVGFACWLWGRMIPVSRRALQIAALVVPVLIIGSAWYCYGQISSSMTAGQAMASTGGIPHGGNHELPWERFTIARLREATAEGRTVLVDFTAAWCPNCHVNERVALNVEGTKTVVEELDVVALQADWTNRDEEITEALRALGFSSIPLTAIFPASNPNEPILLDGLFTAETVQARLREAGGGTMEAMAK